MSDDQTFKALGRLTHPTGDAPGRPGPSCPDEDTLEEYAARRLEGDPKDVVELHLADCGRCTRYVALAFKAQAPLQGAELTPLMDAAQAGLKGGGWTLRALDWLRGRARVVVPVVVGAAAALIALRTPSEPVPQLVLHAQLGGMESTYQGEGEPGGTPAELHYTSSSLVELRVSGEEIINDSGLEMRVFALAPDGALTGQCPSPTCAIHPRSRGWEVEGEAAPLLTGAGERRTLLLVVSTPSQLAEVAERMAAPGDVSTKRDHLTPSVVSWYGLSEAVYRP